MSEIYLARQAIFNRDFKLYGYELLFRKGMFAQADIESEDEATSQVFLAALVDIGLEKLAADCPVHINLSREYLGGVAAIPLLADDVVLEIDAADCLNNVLDAHLSSLVDQGYKLACDHFMSSPVTENTLLFFDEIKCNVSQLDENQLQQAADQAKRHDCRLVATHVENYQQVPFLLELGFEFFQGFFLTRPQLQHQRSVPTNLMSVIQTLARLLDPAMQLQELSEIISTDVSLSYRVLRLIRSAHYSVNNIDSISHAIIYLGRDAIKNLLITIILTRVEGKPEELTRLALVRAKMCEVMAKHVDLPDLYSYFTLGLLSVLDGLLDQSMYEIVEQLPIEKELAEALVDKKGIKGQMLQCVIEYEECRLFENNLPHIDTAELNDFYLQAVMWADETCHGFSIDS